jgi:hypothetical protein
MGKTQVSGGPQFDSAWLPVFVFTNVNPLICVNEK